MTSEEKFKIKNYRDNGYTYQQIADELQMSVSSIKTYCNRNGLGGRQKNKKVVMLDNVCEKCGKPIVQLPGRKKKRFCSDSCRNRWWNEHMDRVNRKAVYTFSCKCCGKQFTAYGNAGRKYCSHECYIEDRFGGN